MPACRTMPRRRESSYEWSGAAWLCSSYRDDDNHPTTAWERHDDERQPNGRVGNPATRTNPPLGGHANDEQQHDIGVGKPRTR